MSSSPVSDPQIKKKRNTFVPTLNTFLPHYYKNKGEKRHWLYRAPGQWLYLELNHTMLHCLPLGLKMLMEHTGASHRDDIEGTVSAFLGQAQMASEISVL